MSTITEQRPGQPPRPPRTRAPRPDELSGAPGSRHAGRARRLPPTGETGRGSVYEHSVDDFEFEGRRLVYETRGSGDRPFVLLHGILLPAGINAVVASRLAERGNRVILLDLLGHGRSDKPAHAYHHRLESASEQVIALLDHLGIDQAVVGGTSLGANVTLQVAVDAPGRLRAGICEMPVLERGTVGVLIQLAPLLFLFRYAGPVVRPVFRTLRSLRGVNRHEVFDAVLGAAGEPREMAAVMHGFTAGPVCPRYTDRVRVQQPFLVVGHRGDFMHPMDDAEALVEELPNARLVQARSFFELRTRPERIIGEMGDFLDEVWAEPTAATGSGRR